eukprot:1062621-Rhodomonas_salina.3
MGALYQEIVQLDPAAQRSRQARAPPPGHAGAQGRPGELPTGETQREMKQETAFCMQMHSHSCSGKAGA